MKTILVLASLLGSGLVYAGMPQVSAVKSDPTYKRSPSKAVAFFASLQSVKRRYKELALLTAEENEWTGSSEEEMIEALRAKAQELGADAIVHSGSKTTQDTATLIGDTAFASGSTTVKVIAIVYE